MKDPIGIEYLAGFFDGEGCININVCGKNRQVKLRLMLSNTDEKFLNEIKSQYGGSVRSRILNPQWKAWSLLVWYDQEAEDMLQLMLPFLRLKAPQARLAIEFRNFMKLPKTERCYPTKCKNPSRPNNIIYIRKPETIEREMSYKDRMHELNRKGVRNVA